MSSASAPTAEKILDAALALLEARPAGPVRMSDIARAAGISRQAVYLHHPTRGQLLVAAARRLDVVKDVDVMEEKIASLAQFHMVRLNRELKEARSAFDNARPPLASSSTPGSSPPSTSAAAPSQSWDRNSLFDIV